MDIYWSWESRMIMDDGYIRPKRVEFSDKCFLCGSTIVSCGDPLSQNYECPNPDCEVDRIDPNVEIYGCVVCGADADVFVNDLPYCEKHIV